MSSIDDDWLTDFAAIPKTDSELEAWLERCKGEANNELRQLILEVRVLRMSSRILLERLRDMGADLNIDGQLRMAVFFIEARKP